MTDPASRPDARSEYGKRFAELLKEARSQLGLRLDDVVNASGVSRRTLTRWEGGESSRPDPDEVRAVCRILRIPPIKAAIALGYIDDVEEPSSPLAIEASHSIRGVAATVRRARAGNGWTQQDLADRAGMTTARLAEIESGHGGYADPSEVRPLYEALGIPRIQLVAVGYGNDVGPEPTVNEILTMLESPDIPDEAKHAFIDYLRYLRNLWESSKPATAQTAAERFCAAIGKPYRPLSPAEKAEWMRLQDEVDRQPHHRRSDPRRDVA